MIPCSSMQGARFCQVLGAAVAGHSCYHTSDTNPVGMNCGAQSVAPLDFAIKNKGNSGMQATDFKTKTALEAASTTEELTDRDKHLIGLAVTLTRGCQACTGRRMEDALQAGIPYATLQALVDLTAEVNAGVVMRTAIEGASRNNIAEACSGSECST